MDLTVILSVIILAAILLVAGLVAFVFLNLKKQLLDSDVFTKLKFTEIDSSIKSSVEPKFLDISPSSNQSLNE